METVVPRKEHEPEAGATAPAVEVNELRRMFGPVPAIRNMSFVAPGNEVTALVGPNGAGKTTLLLVLATLLTPDRGEVKVMGHDPVKETDAVRARMGWAPDVFGLYDNLTVVEYLTYAAASYRLPRKQIPARVDELLALAHLGEHGPRPVHELSRGQKQRLGLIRALVHRPQVLLLDEPASGLDPRGRAELRQLLRSLAAGGTAVVISSHLLEDLEEMADSVVFINRGRTAGQHRVAELKAGPGKQKWRIHSLDRQRLVAALETLQVAHDTARGQGLEVELAGEDAAAALLSSLVTAGVPVVSFHPAGGTLEAAYMNLTEGRS